MSRSKWRLTPTRNRRFASGEFVDRTDAKQVGMPGARSFRLRCYSWSDAIPVPSGSRLEFGVRILR